VLAALCYTIPVIPAWFLLVRERRNPFVRFHAAQSITFYGCIAAGQVGLYLMLVSLGGVVTNDWLAIGIAGLLLLLFLALSSLIVFVWSRLVANCIRGEARLLPIAGPLALRLERFSMRGTLAALLKWRALC
jgi:uncharacterized membrane protein